MQRRKVLPAIRAVWRFLRLSRSYTLTRGLIARANRARDFGNYRLAAALFEEVLLIDPRNSRIHKQCGHMWKEAGELSLAEARYLAAARLAPHDPDLALQMGHFYKVAGRIGDAHASYRRALSLSPGWREAEAELAATSQYPDTIAMPAQSAADPSLLVPELFPRSTENVPTFREGLHIHRLGRPGRTGHGTANLLRGVEAIRGICISDEAVLEIEVLLDGDRIHAEVPREVSLEAQGSQRKYVFNIWLDVSRHALGPHLLEVRATRALRPAHVLRRHLVIAPPVAGAKGDQSDAHVALPSGFVGSVEDWINAQPSVIRPAASVVFAKPPRNILVQRTDQLGDMVTSVPALKRLRALLPQARIVGLVTEANAEFAATLGLFDELIIADFPDDPIERRRLMTAEAQEALRVKLAGYHFDLALDLAESAVSRPLLLLSGAKYLYGFHDREWPWLDFGFACNTHDAQNTLEISTQSSKLLAMIERLGTLIGSGAHVIRRPELDRSLLVPLGIAERDRFIVLHAGGRIAFSRWPYFAALADRILAETDLKIVVISDDAALHAQLDPPAIASGRLLPVAGKLAFDTFDALLSYCAVFVGNDSGPKHLAALRGAPVVSLHSARINWGEWGQELNGVILSRKVPCAGCAIFHDPDECGKDFACIRGITTGEVFKAVTAFL